MKKLSKISLKDATILDEKQLKQVYGGSGTSGCGTVQKCNTDTKCSFSDGLTGHCGIHSQNTAGGAKCGCISGV